MIKCIRAIKGVLLNKGNEVMPNIFTSNKICSLGVTFLADGRKFSYDLDVYKRQGIVIDGERILFSYEAKTN